MKYDMGIRSSLIAGSLLLVACSGSDQPEPSLTVDATLGQVVFSTPEKAAQAFTDALEAADKDSMQKIMGSDYQQLVVLSDGVDKEEIDAYLAAWKQSNSLVKEGEQQRLIAVGKEDWTFPVPIHQGDNGWYFDVVAGLERILIRRIGRNELDTMQAVLAYYDAQMEYALRDHDGNGMLDYAQKFISTPGNMDGLYWKVAAGEAQSPLGPLFEDETAGYAYHGYHYKILKQQGEHASGGAYSYMDREHMNRGFALVAWPAQYEASGVTSFIVSHSGIVYEQDLGPDSAKIAAATTSFDPGSKWKAVQEVHLTTN